MFIIVVVESADGVSECLSHLSRREEKMRHSGSGQYMHDDDLDDEERMTDGAGLLGKKEEDSFEVPCCGWMSVRYYQPVSGWLLRSLQNSCASH